MRSWTLITACRRVANVTCVDYYLQSPGRSVILLPLPTMVNLVTMTPVPQSLQVPSLGCYYAQT